MVELDFGEFIRGGTGCDGLVLGVDERAWVAEPFFPDLGEDIQILLGHAHETLLEDRDRMPLGPLFALAGIAVLPGFRGGDAQVAHLAAVLKAAHFRVTPQIADENYLVH